MGETKKSTIRSLREMSAIDALISEDKVNELLSDSSENHSSELEQQIEAFQQVFLCKQEHARTSNFSVSYDVLIRLKGMLYTFNGSSHKRNTTLFDYINNILLEHIISHEELYKKATINQIETLQKFKS